MPAYPDISDYTDSVQNAATQVMDPVLRNAKPRLKNGKPESNCGGVAVVYPFQNGGDIYAVKCWTRDIGDLRKHYRRVEQFLNSCRSPYFVNFAYIEKGIIARDQIQPFLRMKWVGGKSLLEFVSANISNSSALVQLAERYLVLCEHLHKLGVAHGDLQGSNIKVVGNGTGINIQLIDYDTLVVPASHGHRAEALALPSYQHPKRGAADLCSGKEDYFSELVIYLSLLAVAECPSLWSRFPKGDPGLKDEDRHDKDMLFDKEDFSGSRPSQVFNELFSLSPITKNLTVILWNYTRIHSIDHLLPLEASVKIARESLVGAEPKASKSEFDTLIKLGNNGWLDDSAFSIKSQPGNSAIRVKDAGGHSMTFADLLISHGAKREFEDKTAPRPPAMLPPILSQTVFTVKRRRPGHIFGEKYSLIIKGSALIFFNAKTNSVITFDPSLTTLTLRNPWWTGTDNHIVFKDANGNLVAFSMPLKAWSSLRDWWNYVQSVIPLPKSP